MPKNSKLTPGTKDLPFYVPEQLYNERMHLQEKVEECFDRRQELTRLNLFSKTKADTPEMIRAADAVMRVKGFVRVNREDFADLARSFACPMTIVDKSLGASIVVEYYSVGIVEELEIDL